MTHSNHIDILESCSYPNSCQEARATFPWRDRSLVHKELAARNALPTIGDHKDVMRLEAKVHVRSTRSRFHFNETSCSGSIKLFREAGEPNIKETPELAANSDTLKPADAEAIQTLGEGSSHQTTMKLSIPTSMHAVAPVKSGPTTSPFYRMAPSILYPPHDATKMVVSS